MVGGRLRLPLGGRGGRLFHDGAEVEAARGDDAPAASMNLLLKVVPLQMVDCFFKAMIF